ncbi:MBL fold metallo-hydrolase, partial [Chloroflexota bacterium]
MIIQKLEVGPFLSNCYIVGSEETGKGMVIDPGADAGRILKTVDSLGLSIDLIVATHTHTDHIAAVAQVKEATGADYAVHEAEATKKTKETNTSLNRMLGPVLGASLRSLPEPDRLLCDSDIIKLDELSFNVLHTPGHSPGGICLQGHRVVFCGDTLFNLSIGRTDFPGCSHTQLMESIRTKLMTLPDDTKVYCGHGPETTIGLEREWNPFLNMEVL